MPRSSSVRPGVTSSAAREQPTRSARRVRTRAMTFYRPVWMCGYLLGVFPYTAAAAAAASSAAEPSSSRRFFRLHWFGVTMKTVHVLLFWSSAVAVGKMFYRSLEFGHHQRLKKKLFTTSPLNVDELYVYMALMSLATTAASQLQMMLPSVAALAGECFLQPERCGACTGRPRGYWLSSSAYVGIAFVVYELSMYFVLVMARFKNQYFICLFPLLSNIVCIMVEQYFYIMCLALYFRLQHLHEDITNLVHKAEYPRWKCWVNPTVGGPTRLGIPAFSMSDIRNLRSIHLKAMELFLHINYSFQLPLLLNLLDSGFRIVVYTSELAYYLTNAIWNKNITTNYAKTLLYSGYCLIRIMRLWYLHSCEHYITKKIIPIRISLSWLTLALNPVTSRRLMPEIILFQNQLDAISSKFQIYGIININMTFFYAGFGLLLAYVMFLLQFLGSLLPSSQPLNNFTAMENFLENSTSIITTQNGNLTFLNVKKSKF